MEKYLQLTIKASPPEQAILIALLSELPFDGFEENDDQLLAFSSEKNFAEAAVERILSARSLSYTKDFIEQTNWNEEWEKNFEPIIVEDFCGIRANFHPAINNVRHELIITPKMSFGTGHHATTYLMIEAMKEIAFNNKAVLDLGTGTGILAILAEKSGAKRIIAIDNDEWSILNARENIEANHCRHIQLKQTDGISIQEEEFDIILANINRNVILDQLPLIRQHLKPSSVVLMSGLMKEDLDLILEHTRNNSLDIISKSLKDNWICLNFLTN
jgi:ribosomal protein L11 methyltransferase